MFIFRRLVETALSIVIQSETKNIFDFNSYISFCDPLVFLLCLLWFNTIICIPAHLPKIKPGGTKIHIFPFVIP